MGFRFGIAWGHRRVGQGLPAPPLPELPPQPENYEQGATPYPLYENYDSREQALEAAAVRNQGKDFLPLPAPLE